MRWLPLLGASLVLGGIVALAAFTTPDTSAPVDTSDVSVVLREKAALAQIGMPANATGGWIEQYRMPIAVDPKQILRSTAEFRVSASTDIAAEEWRRQLAAAGYTTDGSGGWTRGRSFVGFACNASPSLARSPFNVDGAGLPGMSYCQFEVDDAPFD